MFLGHFGLALAASASRRALRSAATGVAMWLLIAWAYWIDRHRAPLSAPPA